MLDHFVQNPVSALEELMVMPPVAFQFYIATYRLAIEEVIKPNADDATQLSLIVHAFIGALKWKMDYFPKSASLVIDQCMPFLVVLAARQNDLEMNTSLGTINEQLAELIRICRKHGHEVNGTRELFQ